MDEVIPPLVAAAVSQGQQHQPKATQSNALTFSLSFGTRDQQQTTGSLSRP
jgi:hypothetical protein